MEKKNTMVLIWHDAIEGDGASIYPVSAEDFSRLAVDLKNNAEENELPRLSLEMYSPEQLAEAERIGNEMA